MTLAFSALVAGVTAALALPPPGLLLFFVGTYGLMFLTMKTQNSPMGLVSVFAFTGFMGYTLGPIIGMFLGAGAADTIMLALGGTALTFFALSAYVLTTKKDMSFLGGMMMAGVITSYSIHYTKLYDVLQGSGRLNARLPLLFLTDPLQDAPPLSASRPHQQ